MIETQRSPDQADPCVALHLEHGAVTMEVTARLSEGVRNWTAEEAGKWFAEQWADARQALLTSTIARFAGEANRIPLIRRGDIAWQVVEGQPAITPAVATAPLSELAPPPLLPTPATSIPEPVSNQPLLTPLETEASAAGNEEDPQDRILALLEEDRKQKWTIQQIREKLNLNDYQTRSGIRKLKETKQLTEKKTGRMFVYSAR